MLFTTRSFADIEYKKFTPREEGKLWTISPGGVVTWPRPRGQFLEKEMRIFYQDITRLAPGTAFIH